LGFVSPKISMTQRALFPWTPLLVAANVLVSDEKKLKTEANQYFWIHRDIF